jgi:hypothetical protein
MSSGTQKYNTCNHKPVNKPNGSMICLASVLIISVSLVLSNTVLTSHEVNAQPTPVTAGTNFTKLFSQNKEFQTCITGTCIPILDVVYQGPIMLVLKSTYIDVIWKAVEVAKKEGYKVDGISTFITSGLSCTGADVNVLVAMSKG